MRLPDFSSAYFSRGTLARGEKGGILGDLVGVGTVSARSETLKQEVPHS